MTPVPARRSVPASFHSPAMRRARGELAVGSVLEVEGAVDTGPVAAGVVQLDIELKSAGSWSSASGSRTGVWCCGAGL